MGGREKFRGPGGNCQAIQETSSRIVVQDYGGSVQDRGAGSKLHRRKQGGMPKRGYDLTDGPEQRLPIRVRRLEAG